MAADEAAADEAAIAALRRRADAGDVGALVELGDLLYWDEPEAARAAYQEAVDAGQLQALIGLGMVLRNVLGDEGAARGLRPGGRERRSRCAGRGHVRDRMRPDDAS